MTRPNRGLAATIVIIFIIVVLLAAVGGLWLHGTGESRDENGESAGVFVVKRGDFDITIPASGELAALRETEIASQLDTRAVITEIVEEGVWVEKGTVLIRVEDEAILNRVKDAEVAVKNAETNLQTARTDLQIRQDSNVSQLTLADVDIKLAGLAYRAWQEGEDVSARQELALEVETTKKDHDRLVNRFAASAKLLDEEFISQDEYDRDEIEMIRAASKFEQAKLAQQVYEDYGREQQFEKLSANLKKATDQRAETEQRNLNELTSLETAVENRIVALNREKERLERASRQHEQCTIIAPQAGLVVYASSLSTGRHGRSDNSAPQVGTELARNRTIIILPDTSKMVAEVKVNEALSGRIEKGQRAVAHCDAMPDNALQGVVESVGVLAESGGWRDPNRRDYTVRILLDGANELGLKPSMRCRANLFVGRVEDSIYIPIPAVFRDGPQAYVYVPTSNGFAQTPVTLGRFSELFIEVTDGLVEGDRVMMLEPDASRVTHTLAPTERAVLAGRRSGGRPDGSASRGARGGKHGGQPGTDASKEAGDLASDDSDQTDHADQTRPPKTHSRPGT